VKIYKYDRPQVLARTCPFQGAFANDGWIAYHGTSSAAETAIESQGFVWNDTAYSRSEIEAVANVFRQLGWAGKAGGGLGVLASFSTSDFRHLGAEDRKPIFFSATSKRSLLYASRDWAGGETARAVRIAFEDLDAFLNSQDFRREMLWQDWQMHWQLLQEVAPSVGTDAEIPEEWKPKSIDTITFDHLYRRRLHLRKLNPGWGWPHFAQGTEPVNFTEEWLRERLVELRPLRERCNSAESEYAYGVIYAVRFHETDLDHLLRNRRDLISLASVSSDRIMAKAVIDLEAVALAVDDGVDHDDLEEEMLVDDLDGVFTRARAKAPG
jgi:hypothetical protein